MPYGVITDGLEKRYGDTHALAGLDLAVEAGTVCGLLGHNGAGKTTAVRILTTLARPDGGTAAVAGFDVVRAPDEVRRRIGVVGQSHSVDEVLGGRTNLELLGRLYHLPRRTARRRADELLERFDLLDAAGRSVATYSGGMRRRLDLAASLILDPDVLVLDEPTTGLDPHARASVWAAVRSLVDGGTTVLLTTQYLEEADRLADRITIMRAGRAVAEGTPPELKAGLGGDRVEITLVDPGDATTARAALAAAVPGGAVSGGGHADAPDRDRAAADDDGARTPAGGEAPPPGRLSVVADEPVATLATAVVALRDAGLAVADIGLRRPTLDDVFIDLTREEVPA